MIKILERRFVD